MSWKEILRCRSLVHIDTWYRKQLYFQNLCMHLRVTCYSIFQLPDMCEPEVWPTYLLCYIFMVCTTTVLNYIIHQNMSMCLPHAKPWPFKKMCSCWGDREGGGHPQSTRYKCVELCQNPYLSENGQTDKLHQSIESSQQMQCYVPCEAHILSNAFVRQCSKSSGLVYNSGRCYVTL